MAFRNYILLFSLVVGTISGPINVIDSNVKCATTCTESLSDNAKFKYTPGNTYTYVYEGTTETKLDGSSSQKTNLKVKATADIEVISKCEFALKLREVSLLENDALATETRTFKSQLEKDPLRFAFQDGVIENVCSSTGEDERVLNIKRGILSTFQNSMNQLDRDGQFTESDVSGTCPTTYKSKSGIFGGVTISKTKDILACTDRNGNISSIHSKRYMVTSKIQNLPLLKTSYECDQVIKGSKLEKAACVEVHLFRPFNKGDKGAVTIATQTLTFSSSKSSISTSETPVQRRSSLLFHHLYDESLDADAKSQVVSTLQEICSEVSQEITKKTPILFSTLVSHMKRLSADKMLQVYNSVNGGRICSSLRGKQFFYDAIPMVGTEAALSLMQKLTSEKVVQGVEAEMWLTQLAFIPRPTYEMLKVIKPLLNDASLKSKALLGISAMVHKICDNNVDCQRNAEVADFVNMLSSNIGSSCSSTTPEQRSLILVTLKALGNAGDAITSSSIISRCITNREVDIEVRVAALQAFRRVPCSVDREEAMRIFQKADDDAELRIAAFMAVMSCPTSQVLTKVKMMLSGEPVNQVGSFVWTYLENLRETSTPLKQDLAAILEDAKLREDFNCDVRKFSRNYEKSFFSDYLNAGAMVESNLIWSQRSYIPRSAMFNVSVDMFGNSINLLEVGGRVQGLEKIVEKFFGPNGYFSKKNTKELINSKRETVNANYISAFDNVFKTPDDKITASMYLNAFGNTIAFEELSSDDWAKVQGFNVLDFLIKLAEPKKIDLTKNYQFLDSSLIIPTCVGLPMNLTVNGSASISLDVNGNIDLRNFAASPRSLDIKGHVKPSAAVVVSGLMGVDALVTKSSMKMIATMHSSSVLEGLIQLKDGQIFNFELKTPQKKMEIFHVQTEFFMNGQEMTMPEPAKTFKKCSSPQLTKVIGMEMCVDLTLPKMSGDGLPSIPFTGPMNAQVFIEKKDTHTAYTFTAKYQNERQQVSGTTYTKRTVHLSVDTPGSQVDRKLLVEAILDPAKMEASAQMMTPWKKFSWNSSLENDVKMKRAQAVMKIDDSQEYSFDAQLGIVEKRLKTIWSPSLTINMPNKPKMTVSGNFESGTGKTMVAMDLAIKKFTRKPITVNAAITKLKGGDSYKAVFDIKSDFLTTDLDGSLSKTNGNYIGRTTLTYSFENRPSHRVSVSGKFSDKSAGDMVGYSTQLGVVATEFPKLTFSIDTDVQASANHLDLDVEVATHQDKLTFVHKSRKQGSLMALSADSTTTFKYPNKNIDVGLELKHLHNKNNVKSSGKLTYAPSKTVAASIELDKSVADTYSGEATLQYPGRDLSTKVNINKLGDGERKMSYNAKWGPDADSQLTVTSSWKPGTTHDISADFKIPSYPISVKASVKPDIKDFMGRAEITYRRDTWSLASEYKILGEDSFTSSATYICPHRKVTSEMSGTFRPTKVHISSEFKWDAARDASKMVSFSGEYNNNDQASLKRELSLSLTAPIGKYNMNSDIELASERFGASLTYSHPSGQCTLTSRLSPTSGELRIDSPYIQYGPVKFIEAKYNRFGNTVETELSWNLRKKVAVTAKKSTSMYELEMTTPYELVKTATLKVTLPAENRPFEVKGTMNSNRASMSVSYPDFRNGEFEVVYSGQTHSGSFKQNGNIRNFVGEASLSLAEKKFWSKVEMGTQGPITFKLDVTTPYKLKKISANFNHAGKMMDFTTRAALSWNNELVKTTLTFGGKKAELDVKSPWQNFNAEYMINGEMKNFNSYALAKWSGDKEMRADLTFDITKDVKVTYSLRSPFYDTVSGGFEHFGDWKNFNNKATLTYGNGKTATFTNTLSTSRGLELTSSLESPYNNLRLTANHQGTWKSWDNSAELTIDSNKPIKVYSEFDSEKYYKGKAGIKNAPCKVFRNGEVSFEHKTYANKMSNFASVTWNDNQKMEWNLAMSKKNGYTLAASVKTPFYDDLSLNVEHTGKQKNFENVATLQWAPSKKISVTTTLNTRAGFDAKVKVNSPWRDMSFAAQKQGSSKEFSASTKFSWETGKEISSTLEFSQIRELKATWNLETPFEQLKDVNVVFTHRGNSYEKFYSQLDGRLNKKQANIAVSWDTTNGAELTVTCVNPWKSFNGKVEITGEPKDFSSTASFTMDGKTYSSMMKFSAGNVIDIQMELKPVVLMPMTARFTLSTSVNKAVLTWGDGKTITAEATLTHDDSWKSVNGKASFTTPFEGYESGEAKFTHSGPLYSFRNTAEVSFNGKSATFEAGLTTFGDISGDFRLASPWCNSNGKFRYSGDWKKGSEELTLTYAPGKSIESNAEWNINQRTAEWSFTSPWKSFSTKHSYKYSKTTGLEGHSELTLDGSNIMNLDVTHSWSSSDISSEFKFSSPWKSVTGKYTHRGTMSTRCNAHAELGWDKQTQLSSDWSISSLNGFAATLSVTTPWKSFSAEVDHKGGWKKFDNTLSLTYETGKTIRLVSEFTTSPDYYVKSTFTSPFKNMDASLRHSGNLEHFTTNMEVNYDGKPVVADLLWNMKSGVSATLNIKNPWKNVGAKFGTNFDMNDLSSSAELTWGSEKIDSSLTLKMLSGYEGSFRASTPWRVVSSSFNAHGDKKDLRGNAKFSWETGKEVSAEASFTNKSGSRTAEAKIVTPWRELSTSYRSQGPLNNFDSSVSLSWEAGKTITLETKFSNVSGMNAEVKMTSPWRTVSGTFTFDGTYNKFTTRGNFSWETGKSVGAEISNTMTESYMTVDASATSPWRNLSAKYDRRGTWKNFEATTEMSWAEDKKVSMTTKFKLENGFNLEVDTKTPWKNVENKVSFVTNADATAFSSTFNLKLDQEEVIDHSMSFSLLPLRANWNLVCPLCKCSFQLSHDGDSKNMENMASLTFNGKSFKWQSSLDRRSGCTGSITVTTPWRELKTEFTHKGEWTDFDNSGKFSWESGKEVELSSQFRWKSTKEGQLTIKTPFYDDVKVSFEHNGELKDFKNEGMFSWGQSKKVEFSSNFKMASSVTGAVTLKTPFCDDIEASFEHTGELKNFNNNAMFSWAPSKKVEFSSNFKMASSVTGAVTLKTPFCDDIEASFEHTGELKNFNNNAMFSWAPSKKIEFTSNFKMTPSLTGAVTLKTPFYNDIEASFEHNGELKDFKNEGMFSWAPSKKIEFKSNFKMTPSLTGAVTLKTPFYNDIEASFEHTGELKNFNNNAMFSWAPSKKIEFSSNFKMASSVTGTMTLKTPFCDDIEASFEHTGDLKNFNNKATLSWAPGKKIEFSSNFKMASPVTGAFTLKTPFCDDIEASFEHTGDLKNFNNKVMFSWAPSKKVEFSSNFKMASSITGSAMLKTPFYSDMKVEFDLSKQSGSGSIEVPSFEKLEAKYTFTDMLSWNGELNYGSQRVKFTNSGSFNNGFEWKHEFTSPYGNFEVDVEHKGDLKVFTNEVEAKWNEKTVKLSTNFDMSEKKISQELEIPGFEKVEWSAEYSLDEKSASVDSSFAYGARKMEIKLDGNVVWKKYKSVWIANAEVKTPFEGYENNKLETKWEVSGKLFSTVMSGYLGSPSNSKKFELYGKTKNTATNTGLTSYMKTTLLSDSESQMKFNFQLQNGILTADIVNDLKFHEASKFSANTRVEHSRTSSGLNHQGSFEINCSRGVKKLVWNAGSNHYMCETGLTYTVDSVDKLNYYHKTTWTSKYSKVSHDMTFKSEMEGLKDCEFKLSYDFTQPKKTLEVTIFNNPTSPIDFKSEMEMGDNMELTVEMTTPWEMMKTSKLEFSVNKSSQPWVVKVEGKLNQESFTAEGRMKHESGTNFETSLSFTSQIPKFENLQLSASNSAMSGQYKPHVVIQWASDKKIEMSSTLSWNSLYKVNLDLTTPFDRLRSLVADVTIDNKFPEKLSGSFEFKTNQMSKKLSGEMSFDKSATSITAKLETPFETLSSFEMSAMLKPRLSALVKVNGETIININGNGKFSSWYKHDLDISATYPFWNKYLRLKINNSLNMKKTNAIMMDVEVEYMRGKEVTLSFHHKASTTTNTVDIGFTSPFEKFESINYNLIYEGGPTNWNEQTSFDFYYGKVTTITKFSMLSGITYHQTARGQMKNGAEDFNYQKDLVISGDMKKFNVQAGMSGSVLPTTNFETSWDSSMMKFVVKGDLNKYHAEYTHTGSLMSFSCNYKINMPTSSSWYNSSIGEWTGEWTFKYANSLSLNAHIVCPERDIKLNVSGDSLKGTWDSEWTQNGKTIKYSSSYTRSADRFSYEGSSMLQTYNHKYEGRVTLTETSLDIPLYFDNVEKFGFHAKSSVNADDERISEIKTVVDGKTYEFDGLFKNEGQGLVRNFKLHMMGPRGAPNAINLKFEFQTQSSQLVPGDAKIFLSHINKDKEEWRMLDLTTSWGNDRAVIEFVEPRPMKYTFDFSVNTKGQFGEINANWDTREPNKNFQLKFNNKFGSSSRRMKSLIEIDVVYTGISRGFTSNLNWSKSKFSHKLTLDYNGKEIGYNFSHDETNGSVTSLELISEWRNLKGTWSNVSLSNGRELGFGFYWDSARDNSKKFTGVTRWEETSYHTYKWVTTFSNPTFAKDIVMTDEIAYDTSKYMFKFSKNWSFSTDAGKDVDLLIVLEKNGKWGVELKQDFNKIDFKLGTEFSQGGSKTQLIYKDVNGRSRKFGFNTQLDLANMSGSIELVTPIKSLKLETSNRRNTWSMTLSVDGKKYTVETTCRPDDAYFLLQMSNPKSQSIKFECTKIDNGYKVQLDKIDGSSTTNEGLVAFSMNENKTINGKLYWNPALYSQVKRNIAATKSDIKDALKKMSTASRREISSKVGSIKFGSDFRQIMPKHQKEFELLKQDLESAQATISNAYDRDIFFMKSIDELTQGYIQRLIREFAVIEKELLEFYEKIEPRLMAMGEDVQKLKADLVMRLSKIEDKINMLKSTMAENWLEKTEVIVDGLNSVLEWMQTYIDRASTYVAKHPTMESLKKIHTTAMSKFNEASDMAMKKVKVVYDPETYTSAIYNAHDFVNTQLVGSPLTTIMSVDALKGISDSTMYKLKAYYDYYDVADNVKVFMEHARNIAAEYLNDYLTHYVDHMLNNFKWKQYDLQNGRIEFEFNIPTKLNKVEFVRLKADLMKRWDSLKEHLSKYHFNLRETFYMYKPQAFGDILPPYKAHAIIAGQHIRTFDRRHYDFSSGSCSYLLARDFQDGNFTVFVNYNGKEQSLTVHTNGMTIDIQQDYTVKKDGSKIDLPLQFVNTTITRHGHQIVVTNKLGVTVICDNDHGFCIVEMSGFYFAKTGGLFGTYNNEPLDDWTTSTNKNVSDVTEFANSWASRCSSNRNTATVYKPVKDTKEYRACAAVFKDSSSPLQPCFSVVEPENAFRKCINDMSSDVTLTEKNGPCKAAKFYQAECNIAGVSVYEPSSCVSCQVAGHNLETGKSMQLSQPVLTADVVFVVEEKMCNEDTDSKLPQLAKYVAKSLGSTYSEVRFGLVGFGGDGVHEPNHIHTMNSQIFASLESFRLGTEALKFGAGENKDVFDAINYASQYPFKAGATKVIIVIPCSECRPNLFNYRSLTSKLVGEGIALHVMNDFSYDLTVDGKNPETNYLFGIDNTNVYSLRDARTIRGNSRLYSITKKPTDSCSTLALQTGGTVFDLNMMTKMRSTIIKHFQTVFANRLGMTTYPNRCTACTCEYNALFMAPRTVCKKC